MTTATPAAARPIPRLTRNPGRTRFTKAPKLHWVDIGVQRALFGLRQGLTGAQFESVVVGKLVKLARSLRLDVEMSYLRTKDGREVGISTWPP